MNRTPARHAPVHRTQESRSAASRALLVRAAIETLTEGGFRGATSAAIAARAGVTTGALHHHFPAKEDLFLAVLDELTERALALFRDLASARRPGDPVGRTIVDGLWQLYGSTQYWAVWEINMGYRGDAAMHRRLVEHRAATRGRMFDTLRANPHLDAATQQVLQGSLVFVLSALRGIFLDTFFAPRHDELLRGELDALAQVLDDRLALASATVAAAPRRPRRAAAGA